MTEIPSVCIIPGIRYNFNQQMNKLQSTTTIVQSNQQQEPPTSSQDEIPFTQLFRYSETTDKIMIAVGVICSCAMGAAFPIFGFLTGSMVDSFDDQSTLLKQASRNLFLYIGLGAAAMVTGAVMFSIWTILGERQAIKCRQEYFRSIMRQEMAWFDLNDQNSIAAKFQLDVQVLQCAVGQKISSLLLVISMLVVGIGLSLYIGWILTLIVLAYIPIVILIWTKDMNTRIDSDTIQDQVYRESDSKVQETLSSIKLVKQLNGQNFECSMQQNILNRVKEIYKMAMTKFIVFSALAVLALDQMFPLVFWYGSQCIFNTKLCPQSVSTEPYTAGSIIKILYSLLIPAISLNQLSPCLLKIQEGKKAAKRIYAIINRQPLIQSKEGAIIPSQFKGVIQFKNVSFAYPKNKDKKIFDKFNLLIDCRHSAIIGASGNGKSTIFQLIMRFYDPDQGNIYLDDIDLKDLKLEWLRSQIGYVNQQPILFATSIRQNLLLAKSSATEQQIQNALIKAQAYDFVSNLKQKTDTFVGSGGSQLSGGQKQRIAIARILLKGCKLILMDQATSALDLKSQSLLLKTFKEMQSDFVSISITHRKKVLADCDKIYKLNGNIVTTINNRSQGFNYIYSSSSSLSDITHSDLRRSTSLIEDESGQITKAQNNKTFISIPKKQKAVFEAIFNNFESEANLWRVCPYISEHKCKLFFGVLACIIHGLCFPAFGIVLAKIIKQEIEYLKTSSNDNMTTTKTWYLIALGIAFLDPIFAVIGKLSFGLVAKDTIAQIRMEAYGNVIRMPVDWFEREYNSPQKIASQITVSCKNIYNFVKLFIPHLVIILVNILFSLIGALIFQWRTGLTAFGLIPLIVLSQAVQLSFVLGLTQSKNKIYSESIQTIKESVINIRTILSLGAEPVVYQQYNKQLSEVISVIKGKAILSGLMYGLASFLQFVSFAMIFFLSAIYIDKFKLGVQGPLEAIFLILYAGITAGNNSNYLSEISKAKTASKTIFVLIDLENQEKIRDKNKCKRMTTPIKGNIRFEDVEFKYDNREQIVLKNFNLEIKQGQNIAIVGRSGCGKSTLFSLLLGFYAPTKGRILLQGIDINDYDLSHIRQSFGVVSQQPLLFNQSVAWNIRYNLINVTDEDIQSAARRANYIVNQNKLKQQNNNLCVSQDRLNQNENGFEYDLEKNVGPRGFHVSGGQKQRIAIARAILRSPSVLLLDQATSALDPQNQFIVQKAIQKLMQNKTTLNITHRLEQIQHQQRVVVLKEGKIEDDGQYALLVERDGDYFRKFNDADADRKND